MRLWNKKLHPYCRFAIYLLLGGLAGGLLGGLLSLSKNGILSFFASPQWRGGLRTVQDIYPYLYVIICIVTGVISSLFPATLRQKSNGISYEMDYEEIEPLEHSCNKVMFWNNLMSHVIFALTVGAYMIQSYLSIVWNVIYLAAMSLSLVSFTVSTRKALMLRHRFEPKKKADILAKGFRKNWLKECDEQEKMEVYRCGYFAWEKMMYVMIICMGLTAFSGTFLGTGYYPFFLVLSLSVFHHIFYYYGQRKSYER